MIELGTSSIPNMAITNTVPLKTTARLAVSPETLDRGVLLAPLGPLLAVAGDDEQGVVDPEREPHPREHVDDEDGKLEPLGEERDEAEGDDDRDARHQDRNEPRHDRSEDEQEDDERCRKAELELAGLEVLLREQIEVVVECLVTGDGDGERCVLVGARSTSSTSDSVSSSSRIAIGTIVAWRSEETSPGRVRRGTSAHAREKWCRLRPTGDARSASNWGVSTA